MASESTDLPKELLEKLRNLELELEEGDITQKGFQKKKDSLLEEFTWKTQPKDDDLGPEPSAADVVDFLDLLPSPTRSPAQLNREAVAIVENRPSIRPETTSWQPSPTNSHAQQSRLLEQPLQRPPDPNYYYNPPPPGYPQYQMQYQQYPPQYPQHYPQQRPQQYYYNRPRPNLHQNNAPQRPPYDNMFASQYNQPQQFVRSRPSLQMRGRPVNTHNPHNAPYIMTRDPARQT